MELPPEEPHCADEDQHAEVSCCRPVARLYFQVVYLGANWYGAKGVLAGEAFGAVIFGSLAVVAAFYLIRRLEREHVAIAKPEGPNCPEADRQPPL